MKENTVKCLAEKRFKRPAMCHYKRTKDPPGKSASIFEYKSQSQSDRTSDLINADCTNRGYRLAENLGEGAYAKVKRAEVMPSKLARNQTMADIAGESGEMEVALKIISKKVVPEDFLLKFLPREISNHSKVPAHKHIVRLFDHFSTQDHVYMVLEYCRKGDLLDLINKHIGENERGIGEDLSRKIFLQICSAVQHLHSHLIVHRDLKCENILLDDNLDIKLTDFGFSSQITEAGSQLKTSCGSYAYTAPEVIRGKQYDGFRSDIWSLGVILFAMVNGRLPFNDNQMMEMQEEMKMQRLRFERHVSFDCMVLIRKLLQYHPSVRPKLDDVIDDPWLTGKKPIPRQGTRPKWINPYTCHQVSDSSADVDTLFVDPTSIPKRSKPICFKASSQKGHSDPSTRTVTLNQTAGETVTLKSTRTARVGPKLPLRPNTWPKSTKEAGESSATTAPKKPDFRYIAQLVMMNKDKMDQPAPGNEEGFNKQVPLWFMYNKLLRDKGMCGDSASGEDTKSNRPTQNKHSNDGKTSVKDDAKEKAKNKTEGTVNYPACSGSTGKLTKTKTRLGSTGAKSDTTDNRRFGFPQRAHIKKHVPTKSRKEKCPVEGSKKPMTPKSANFGRTKGTATVTSPGVSKSTVTSTLQTQEAVCTPRAIDMPQQGEGRRPKVLPKFKFAEANIEPGEPQPLPPLMGKSLKKHDYEVQRYQGNRRMPFCPLPKKHRHKVIIHSCS